MRLRNIRIFTLSAAAVVLMICVDGAHAVSVTGNAADYDYDPGTRPDLRIGRRADNVESNAVYIFELPVITAPIASANLDFQVLDTLGSNPGGLSANLNGVGFYNNTTPRGTNPNPFAEVVLLQNDILDGDLSQQVISTDSTGDANLATYLQGFYDANPTYSGGEFVFLQLGLDNLGGTFDGRRYEVGAVESTTGIDPTLTIALVEDSAPAVPEPASVALVGFAGLGLLAARRRA